MSIDFAKLTEPFALEDIEWRVGNRTKKGDKATLLPYLTSRAVQKRLDEAVGPAHWRDSYVPITAKQIGFVCTLELEVSPGVWVGKADGADVTDIESIKGGISDALKRAAVKWGIGRYLYDLPEARYLQIREGYAPDNDTAVNCPIGDGDSKKPGHVLIPKLPAWALPPTSSARKSESAPTSKTTAAAEEPKAAQAAKTDDPKPQANQTGPAATNGEKLTRAQKLVARCVKLEEQLGAARVQDARREARVPAGDLAGIGLSEEELVKYGTALSARGTARAA